MTTPPLVAVVDDDPSMLKALGRVLGAGGFEPVLYASAEQFLDSPPVRLPTCLVLDVKLGGMSGLELHRRLRALGSTLPVIMLSALEDPPVRDEAFRLGCVAYLDKEADVGKLVDSIRSLSR